MSDWEVDPASGRCTPHVKGLRPLLLNSTKTRILAKQRRGPGRRRCAAWSGALQCDASPRLRKGFAEEIAKFHKTTAEQQPSARLMPKPRAGPELRYVLKTMKTDIVQ